MFREKFKYYKRKLPPPDLSTLLKIPGKGIEEVLFQIQVPELTLEGLNQTSNWKIYKIVAHPGLYCIKNIFTPKGQRYWIRECLEKFPKPTNKNNLLQLNIIGENQDWWQICKKQTNLYKKLRWVTLGYHHNWDTKIYSETERSEFPEKLYNLCKSIGKVFNWEIEAQAAIVNYYHMDSTLSGHTDHSEPNNTAPLFSFSFGQDAIFLIGGKTVEDNTTGILVKSGDCIVMSDESRLCYHAVPRILHTSERSWLDENIEEDWYDFEPYVSESRINLNVRQVLFPGQIKLDNS